MFVSGGKILAIDHVNTGETILGDGVARPLEVNTELIATNSTVSSVSSTLNQRISEVSGNFDNYYPKTETSAASEISAALENVKTNQTIVSAGKNVGVQVTQIDEKTIVYTVSADDVEQRTIKIEGNNGVSAHYDTNTSAWNIGVSADYLSANALDNYYNKEDVDTKFTKTSAWANDTFQPSGNYLSANALDNYFDKDEVNQKLNDTSAWANGTFQIKGDYVSATEFAEYKTEVNTKFENTSAWANATFASASQLNNFYTKDEADEKFQPIGNYVSADEFAGYKTEVDTKFENTSAWASATFASADQLNNYYTKDEADAKFQLSGDYITSASDDLAGKNLVLKDNQWTELEEKDWTEEIATASAAAVSSAVKTIDNKFNLTEDNEISGYDDKPFYHQSLEDYYKKDDVDTLLENTSAWANAKFQPSGNYLSANALDDISGAWNEVSAYSATSGKFVTSAEEDFTAGLAHVLVKDENDAVTWSGVDLSSLGKIYDVSSLTPDLISAGISSDEHGQFYVLSAAKPSEIAIPSIGGDGCLAEYNEEDNQYQIDVQLRGISGVSAEWNDVNKEWIISIGGGPAYASFNATTTENEGVYTPDTYSEIYNVGRGIKLTSNVLSVGTGLWHITIYAKVTNTTTSTEYYDTTLACNSIKNIVQFDNSYIHSEYVNLDVDINNDTANDRPLTIEISDVPADAIVEIEQLQIHKIVAGNVTNEGGSTYTNGNGITIDNYQINVNAGSGLDFNSETNKLDVQAGSGVFVDANNKLSIKLGKGLAFSADGDVVAIETNTEVNDVIDTVENLKNELDGKLTTNMNISDAKDAGCPWDGDTTNINNIAASFFTIPLQHNLTSASEISFFATQGLGQSDADPLVIGILEYNFDYFEADAEAPNGVKTRSQTQWIADTGPIWYDTLDINNHALTAGAGRYTYKLKNVTVGSASDVTGTDGTVYHNEFGPSLRSDRAYYLALYTYSPNSYKYFLCDNGYAGGINNTDPAISFRKTGTTYTDADGVVRSINRDMLALVKSQNLPFSMSGMEYWDRHTNDANNMKRPYVMIRNPRL